MQVDTNARAPKIRFFAVSLIQTHFLCVIINKFYARSNVCTNYGVSNSRANFQRSLGNNNIGIPLR